MEAEVHRERNPTTTRPHRPPTRAILEVINVDFRARPSQKDENTPRMYFGTGRPPPTRLPIHLDDGKHHLCARNMWVSTKGV